MKVGFIVGVNLVFTGKMSNGNRPTTLPSQQQNNLLSKFTAALFLHNIKLFICKSLMEF